ncbi:MAG: hypothetical protein ABIN95_13735 [Mucilaginibacter sp.]
MKKLLLPIFFVCIMVCNAIAQSEDKSRFSLELGGGLPIGDASHKYYFAINTGLKANILIADNLFLTGAAGYTYLHGKNHTLTTSKGITYTTAFDVAAIPVKGGLRYYFDESFFFEGQAGVAIFTEGGKSTAFIYSPSLGYTFTGGFELNLRYESWSKVKYATNPLKKDDTIGQVALGLGFGF